MIALIASVSILTAYVMFSGVVRPRYLLPWYALLAIPAALGVWEITVSLWRRSQALTWIVGLSIIGLGWSWHGTVLADIAQNEAKRRAGFVFWGDVVKKLLLVDLVLWEHIS